MKILLKISCLLLFCYSCNAKRDLTNQNSRNMKSDYFTIEQIKKEQNIYIIYASKNDTLFKILSGKRSIFHLGQEKIHLGGKYKLDLETLFPKEIFGFPTMPPGGGGATATDFNGISVSIEPEKNIWDLFQVHNLNGLYIKKKYCKP